MEKENLENVYFNYETKEFGVVRNNVTFVYSYKEFLWHVGVCIKGIIASPFYILKYKLR